MKKAFKLSFFATCVMATSLAFGQELVRDVPSFRKIMVAQRINLVLTKGEKEAVRIAYANVDPSKINVKVNGSRLLIYLEDARLVEKQKRNDDDWNDHREGIYKNATITAYVTYRELSKVEVRGEQEVTCNNEIESEKFKLKAYGEIEARFKTIDARTFKATLYGENKLRVADGKVGHQVYRLFGENRIDTQGLTSKTTATKIYGEGKISLKASEEVRITAFGEPRIDITGTSRISKGLIFGNAAIRTRP